jgi:beta-lactamase class A
LLLFTAVTVLSAVGCARTPAAAASSADSRPEATPTPTHAKKKPAPKKPSAQRELDDAVGSLISGDDGHAAVTVDDPTTGQTASDNGDDDEFVTASIVKVDILATLLYQSQRSGQPLTDDERELATTMIETSDNDAASDLYETDGGASPIDDANQVFGLTRTTVGTDGYWGLTTTTTENQVRLLRQVFTGSSALSSSSRDYVQGLMSHVESDQRWGVPAAASGGTESWVKNGWLPNPDLWEINSIGEVTHDGQHLLIAVLSDDNETEDVGISLAQTIAKRAASALATTATATATVTATVTATATASPTTGV